MFYIHSLPSLIEPILKQYSPSVVFVIRALTVEYCMCACFSHHRCKRNIHPQLSSMETLDLDCSRLFKINFAIDFCTNRSVVFVPSTVSSADCTEKMDAATVKPLTELWTNILKPQQHFGCPHVNLCRSCQAQRHPLPKQYSASTSIFL